MPDIQIPARAFRILAGSFGQCIGKYCEAARVPRRGDVISENPAVIIRASQWLPKAMYRILSWSRSAGRLR